MAEGGGFEPPRAFTQHAFQACALNRSAIPPAAADYSHSEPLGNAWRANVRQNVERSDAVKACQPRAVPRLAQL